MSSNIQVQKICQFCESEFTAKTTTTKFCSLKCASRHYKKRAKEQKVAKTTLETITIKSKPILDLKNKEYLTVKEVALLLGFAPRTIYRLIQHNKIIAYNFSQRMTVIKRSDIDALFQIADPGYEIVLRPIEKDKQAEIEDCYTITEIQQKFNISNGALYNLLKRKNIQKFTIGKFTYVAKKDIDAIF
jgi:excisionase family DNA binding protein